MVGPPCDLWTALTLWPPPQLQLLGWSLVVNPVNSVFSLFPLWFVLPLVFHLFHTSVVPSFLLSWSLPRSPHIGYDWHIDLVCPLFPVPPSHNHIHSPNSMSESYCYHFQNISCIQSSLFSPTAMTQASITSHLDYCSSLPTGLPVSMLVFLQFLLSIETTDPF